MTRAPTGPEVFVVSNRGVRVARLSPLQHDPRTIERRRQGRRQKGVQFRGATTFKANGSVTTAWSEKTWVDAALVHDTRAAATAAWRRARQKRILGGAARSIETIAIELSEARG